MHTTPRRLFPCILSRDPYRRVRVGMALLALLLMSSSALVMLLLHHPSANHHLDAVRWWAALSVGGLAVITLLIRTGWSERLRDPSLTLVQMAWTITSGAVAYVLAGEGRGVVPSVLAMILFFGALWACRRARSWALGSTRWRRSRWRWSSRRVSTERLLTSWMAPTQP